MAGLRGLLPQRTVRVQMGHGWVISESKELIESLCAQPWGRLQRRHKDTQSCPAEVPSRARKQPLLPRAVQESKMLDGPKHAVDNGWILSPTERGWVGMAARKLLCACSWALPGWLFHP